MQVTLLDTKTGQKVIVDDDIPHFAWVDGNW